MPQLDGKKQVGVGAVGSVDKKFNHARAYIIFSMIEFWQVLYMWGQKKKNS